MIPERAGTKRFSKGELSSLQRMEAEWVSQELAESVKLVQQYRVLYLTAAFVTLGWVLSKLLDNDNSQATTVAAGALEMARNRTDIAVVLCFVPLVNALFAFLLLETAAHIRTLARYRFILGYELGRQSPAWRWEIWKSSDIGSTRGWTAPLNVLFALFLVILSIGALWLAYPAAQTRISVELYSLWIAGMIISLALLVVSAITGFRYRHRNHVALVPEQGEQWKQLSAIQPNRRGAS